YIFPVCVRFRKNECSIIFPEACRQNGHTVPVLVHARCALHRSQHNDFPPPHESHQVLRVCAAYFHCFVAVAKRSCTLATQAQEGRNQSLFDSPIAPCCRIPALGGQGR